MTDDMVNLRAGGEDARRRSAARDDRLRGRAAMAAAKAKGTRPGHQPLDMKKVEAAMKLIEARTPPAEAAKQLGLGRSTVSREMRRLGISRPA